MTCYISGVIAAALKHGRFEWDNRIFPTKDNLTIFLLSKMRAFDIPFESKNLELEVQLEAGGQMSNAVALSVLKGEVQFPLDISSAKEMLANDAKLSSFTFGTECLLCSSLLRMVEGRGKAKPFCVHPSSH
jgi:hypothetical protein